MPRLTNSLRRCSKGGSMLRPTESPRPSRAPRLAASMVPGPPPVMMAKPRRASSAASWRAASYIGSGGGNTPPPHQAAGGVVHGARGANPRRTEEGDGRTARRQCIEARHELGLDAQHPPGVTFEELRGALGPLQQFPVLDLPLHAAPDDPSGPPLSGIFPHSPLTL